MELHPELVTIGGKSEEAFENLRKAIEEAWNSLPDSLFESLWKSMPSRVKACHEAKVLKSKEKIQRNQNDDLRKYLRVPKEHGDDLSTAEDARMSGTCEWFSKKRNYEKWRNFDEDSPSILWVTGNPATGKSVLTGYIIRQLYETDMDCSYFFFKYGDKSKSRLGACLRSLAFQMASRNADVRDLLLGMKKDDIKFDIDNERTIWRTLFLSGIFKIGFPRHYWIIDALDECSNYVSFFESMLAKLDVSLPIRILIISRATTELEKQFSSLGTNRFQSEKISIADTLPDIKLLVETKAKSLVVQDDRDRDILVGKVLEKSQGSFLWTVLVVKELLKSYGEEEINQVLDDVPPHMGLLYQRALDVMSQSKRGKQLAKAILTWTTCAIRPLTTKELGGALAIDFNDNFVKLEEVIVAICGQLVTIDKLGKVHMVHETAREFLLKPDTTSEFAVNQMKAHTQIARVCLTYLAGEEMKPPRSIRRGAGNVNTRKRAGFSFYACLAFSHHLTKAGPPTDDILLLVDKFLRTNILSWIQVIAQTQNLTLLVQVAKDLSKYSMLHLAKRSSHSQQIEVIQGWAVDLIRIAAKFGDTLITNPLAAYSLILPFCPTESMIYKTKITGQKLSVVGLSNSRWGDRLSCMDFRESQTSAVCHGDEFYAVGLSSGSVTLYHRASCQEYKTISHGEAVRFLQFKIGTDLIAICGLKTIRIWDFRNSETIYRFPTPRRPIGLEFDKNILIVASDKNFLASWDLDEGIQRPDKPWNDSVIPLRTTSHPRPYAISISMSHKMLAIAYSGQPITLWDLERDIYYGNCGKKLSNGETSTHVVTAIVFNPNPNIGLLAVSYLDGELAILNPFDDEELRGIRADCHTLAASPNGLLLAGGSGFGTIKIFKFETLGLIYQIKSSNSYIRQLAFDIDGFHLTDIRGSQCNVWDVTILLRDSINEYNSEDTMSPIVEAVSLDAKIKISAMALYSNQDAVICGKNDGSVSIYSLKTGVEIDILYRHKSLVRIITLWHQRDIIMSVDASNGILVWSLKRSGNEHWVVENMLLHSRLDCGKSIIQVLPDEAADKFLLSTRESDHLWGIYGQQKHTLTYPDKPGSRKWIQHQHSPLHMICIETTAARICTWEDWSEVAYISLSTDLKGLQLKSLRTYNSGLMQRMLLEYSELDGSASTQGLILLDTAPFKIESNTTKKSTLESTEVDTNVTALSSSNESAASFSIPLAIPQLKALSHHIAHIVRLGDDGTLVFLDTNSWICSVNIENLDNSALSCSKHFFVPYDWSARIREVICMATMQEVIFVRNDEIAIVKGWMDYAYNFNIEIEDRDITPPKKLVAMIDK